MGRVRRPTYSKRSIMLGKFMRRLSRYSNSARYPDVFFLLTACKVVRIAVLMFPNTVLTHFKVPLGGGARSETSVPAASSDPQN
jgi:hypothetical protein